MLDDLMGDRMYEKLTRQSEDRLGWKMEPPNLKTAEYIGRTQITQAQMYSEEKATTTTSYLSWNLKIPKSK